MGRISKKLRFLKRQYRSGKLKLKSGDDLSRMIQRRGDRRR